MRSNIRIEGIEELERRFRRIDRESQAKIREQIERSADAIETKARSAAPKDDGDLINGIKKEIKEDGLSGAVVSRAPHSHLVEFGTKDREHKSGKSTGKMPKNNAFLFPSAESERNNYLQGIREVFRQG